MIVWLISLRRDQVKSNGAMTTRDKDSLLVNVVECPLEGDRRRLR